MFQYHSIFNLDFFQYVFDNIDVIEETLDGMETFHAIQMVAFQRGQLEKQHKSDTIAIRKEKS